jgi:hypothetical protein
VEVIDGVACWVHMGILLHWVLVSVTVANEVLSCQLLHLISVFAHLMVRSHTPYAPDNLIIHPERGKTRMAIVRSTDLYRSLLYLRSDCLRKWLNFFVNALSMEVEITRCHLTLNHL